jgi:ferrous iron transport protein A
MRSLDQFLVGQRGRIDRIQGQDALVQRLMEMGVMEGEEVEVLGFAPLGDPVEIRLGDSRLSLRRSEAARVWLIPLPEDDKVTR